MAVAFLVLRNWHKAGLLTTVMLLLFFTYGHLYQLLEQTVILGLNLGRHRVLIPVFGLLLIAGTVITYFLNENPKSTRALNMVALVLVLIPAFQITGHFLRVSAGKKAAETQSDALTPLRVSDIQELPDFYFIVLDAYTRADALLTDFNFDNTPFLDNLTELGFFVAECSRTNYSYTQGAITAALNMNYLPALFERLENNGLDSDDIWILLKQSQVRQQLEDIGYITVTFETGYEWSQMDDSDIYLGLFEEPYTMQMINPFEAMLVRSTGALILTDALLNRAVSNQTEVYEKIREINFPYTEYAERQLFILDQLPEIPAIPGHKFVFVHLLIPHHPNIFAANGEFLEDPGYYSGKRGAPINDQYQREGYIQEIQFINNRMLEIAEKIIARSQTPPVIVIQGDHGLRRDNRLKILNTYYLAEEARTQLYPGISPVNSFRVIFNTYFKTDYPLLPDISYHDEEPAPEDSAFCLQGAENTTGPGN